MRDLKNNMDVVQSINPATYNTNQDGAGVDLQGYGGAMVVFQGGAKTNGDHTPKIQESDDNMAWSDVDSSEQEGALVDLVANSVQRVGYKGNKRYIRPHVDSDGATGMIYGATVVRGFSAQAPIA